jgi:hypothetical protein
MAIIKDAEIWFAKLDPKKPSAKLNKANPTWECQLRTSNPEQKKEWEALGLKTKLMVYKEGQTNEAGEDICGEPILNEQGKKQWRANLKKKSITKNGEKASPVKVVNGQLEDVDPNTIGNGSIAHIRIFQYEYPKADGTKGTANVIMGVQLKRHKVYTPKAGDDFEMSDDYETIDMEDNEGGEPGPNMVPPSAGLTPPAASTPSVQPADQRPESAF